MALKETEPFDIFRIVRCAALAAACVAASAAVGSTYYVDGSVGTSGTGTKLSPFKTIAEGVTAATTAGDIVEVAKGVYTNTATLVLSKAITVRGATGSPGDVTVDALAKTGVRCFEISAAATVANMTLARGYTSASRSGGCVYATAACVVSNCVLTGGLLYNGPNGAAAYLNNGAMLVDCKVCNNYSTYNGSASGGLFVHVQKGSLIRTLIVNNVKGNTQYHNDSSVSLVSGTIDHCTIANNSSAMAALIVSDSAACTVTDTIVWGNTAIREARTGAPNVAGGWTKANVTNLCTTGSFGVTPLEQNPSFVDQAGNDYSLSAASPCIGAGTGGSDIGAIPYDSTKATVGMRVSSSGGNDSVTVTHTLVAGGGWTLTGATVRWAFDGRALGSSEAGDASGTSATHTYTAGSYSPTAYVRLAGAAEDVVVKLPNAVTVYWTGTAYVDSASKNPVAPYSTAATAATNLTDVVPYAGAGATVLVAEGTYDLASASLSILKDVSVIGTGARENTKVTTLSRCFYLGNAAASLKNLTLTGGTSKNKTGCRGPAAWIAAGCVSNCWAKDCYVSGNVGYGGVWMTGASAVFTHSLVSGSRGDGFGAGMGVMLENGTLSDCLIISNRANTLTGNSKGGGVYVAGGTAVNCTIAANTGYQGGGVWRQNGGSIKNCLIYGNTSSVTDSQTGSRQVATAYSSISFFFNCCLDVTNGVATQKATIDPFFPATYEIDPANGSICINTGNNDYVADATDYFGNARIFSKDKVGVVDIGAHEYSKLEIVPGFKVEPMSVTGAKPITFTATVQGVSIDDCTCVWYLDGAATPAYEGKSFTTTLATGAHRVKLVLTYEGESFTVESKETELIKVYPTDCYADAASTTAVWPFETPETAASNLNEVVTDALRDGGTLHVAAGKYPVKSSLAIGTGMRLLGAGSDETCIYATGKGYSVLTLNGVGAYVECVCASNGNDKQGAGVHISGDGGHFTRGKVTKCRGQTNWSGGGCYVSGSNSKISRSIICDNRTFELYGSNSGHCGGGATVVGGGLMENCLVVSNHADNCAAVYLSNGTLRNCTITGNRAYCSNGRTGGCTGIGGVYAVYYTASSVLNCIVSGNIDPSAPSADDPSVNVGGQESSYSYDCIPGGYGTNCVTNNPQFRHPERMDYRIGMSSPCRLTGLYQDWMATATDYFGNSRAFHGKVDMGYFQTTRRGLVVVVE